MNLEGLDLAKLSKLIIDFIEEVQCLKCCKYYMAPETAACGHTLCHTCWIGRRSCPECGKVLNRKTVKPNIPLQTLTHYVQSLAESFEKLFNIKLDDVFLETLDEQSSEKDREKNVKNWLTSSQNHFSATIQNTEPFSQESQELVNPMEITANNVIIHTDAIKTTSPKKVPKVVHVTQPQDDWDKIEPMPDIEHKPESNKNIIGPMDIEPFFVDDIEYTLDNPRRSSRKKDVKENEYHKTYESSHTKLSSKEVSSETDKKSQKPKQNWSNVKKMRKEFNKLKAYKSKLNVSIDMVKRNLITKPLDNCPVEKTQVINIGENTQDVINKENELNTVNSYLPTVEVRDSVSGKNVKETINDKTPSNANPNSKKSTNKTFSMQDKLDKKQSKPQTVTSFTKSKSHIEADYNKNENVAPKMPFIKKSSLCPKKIEVRPLQCEISNQNANDNSEDIEISIKVRNIITNIVITKKNDVQVKTNIDREVQTSSGPQNVERNEFSQKTTGIDKANSNKINNNNTESQSNVVTSCKTQLSCLKVDKSSSGKKNTASAETATAQFEITESVEKELLNAMEYETAERNKGKPNTVSDMSEVQVDTVKDIEIEANDLDIFNSDSMKQVTVKTVKDNAPSEILTSTGCSKLKSQCNVEKRNRDINEEETLPKTKKAKIAQDVHENYILADSEAINYDSIMSQVFANIDADIQEKGTESKKDVSNKNNVDVESQLKNNDLSQIFKTNTPSFTPAVANIQVVDDKNSENVFSNLEKFDENSQIKKNYKTQQMEDMLTPVCVNIDSSQESQDGAEKSNKSRKLQECDDSDKSVVEETPQKQVSISKLKRANTSKLSQNSRNGSNKIASKSLENKSVINISDTLSECNQNMELSIIKSAKKKHTPETPLTITKFAGDIIHKSTPVARKSLNYDKHSDNNVDPEETLFPLTDVVVKTTLEKEFMSKAFESTPEPSLAKPLMSKNVQKINKNFCLAGSCLAPSEIAIIKTLCAQNKWTFVDKYTKDITHLVVGVDEKNKSQRSVKYMCALAASKWIVSFDWINHCIHSKSIVNEIEFEALDTCGEPGPRRSRLAKQKLFQGIKFYCMPPFSVLDVDTFKGMLISAGGRVMSDMSEVRVSEGSSEPALLLAEPEHTQEDRFIYLAMENKIVPVNYEWALNCLGSYSLSSIQDLLLCPSTLLPSATASWPQVLLLNEDE